MYIAAILLSIASAVLTLLAVRPLAFTSTRWCLTGALLSFASACWLYGAGDGFWSGTYTVMSIYFLVCIVLPWVVLLMEQTIEKRLNKGVD